MNFEELRAFISQETSDEEIRKGIRENDKKAARVSDPGRTSGEISSERRGIYREVEGVIYIYGPDGDTQESIRRYY